MRSFNKFLLAGFMTLGLFACSSESDVVTPEGGEETTADAVYMQFKLELPSVGTRSTTDENSGNTNSDASGYAPDYEVGQNVENTVQSVYIVLATQATAENLKPKILAYDELTKQQLTDITSTVTDKIYTVEFESADLALTNKGDVLNVYAFCNPTTELISLIQAKGEFIDSTEVIDDAEKANIWTNDKFLMTNADNTSKITVPDGWEPYYVKTNPFDLGVIAVERAAARFDYKAVKADNTYTILNDATNATAQLQVTLTDVALINMSKEYYYLRRVSNDGFNTNATVGGTETKTNYVVDTDAADKNAYNTTAGWAKKAENFFYNMEVKNVTDLSTVWSWTKLTDITGTNGTADNWNGTQDETDDEGNTTTVNAGDYYIWRYAVENTIPSPSSNQVHGITTGVVFKGKLVGDKVTAANKEPIYIYQNVLYGTYAELTTAVKKNDNPSLVVAYEKLQQAITLAEGKTVANVAVGQFGFTRYEANDDGDYEMYYYYWNRHNDNGNNAVMGTMEFSVVRNNVYKLAVESVSNFGHPDPTDPGDDPDPVDPKDPDEEKNIYFKVSVRVLPWVVRVNNIEF